MTVADPIADRVVAFAESVGAPLTAWQKQIAAAVFQEFILRGEAHVVDPQAERRARLRHMHTSYSRRNR